MSTPTPPPPSTRPPAPGSPASWQTIFWTLVPLALNSMSQPGGRICGLPSRYRTYLRCSPALCAADALAVALELLAACAVQGARPREAVGMLLCERFGSESVSDSDSGSGSGPGSGEDAAGIDMRSRDSSTQAEAETEDESEGIQVLEKMTWLRWAFFALGTLPSAIKLLAMRGVGWEQAWGVVFLASWVFNEALMVFAAVNQDFYTVSRGSRISWPGFERARRDPGWRRLRIRLVVGRGVLAAVALTAHVVMLNGVFRAVFRRWRTLGSSEVAMAYAQWPFEYSSVLSFPVVLAISFGVLGFLAVINFILRALHFSILKNGFLAILGATFVVMVINSASNVIQLRYAAYATGTYYPYIHPSTRYTYAILSSSAQYVFAISTLLLLCTLSLLQFLGRRFVMLGANLLVTYPDGPDGESRIDQGACLSLLFFLVTVLGCGLWYGCIYDSSSTFNPTWTGIFG